MFRRLTSDRELRLLLLAFVLSRLLLTATGLLGRSLLPPGKALIGKNLRVGDARTGGCRILAPGEERGTAILDIWARWDSEWYLLIAANGYDAGVALGNVRVAYDLRDTSGFFPLYPLLIGSLRFVAGGVAAGVFFSNLCLLGSLWFFLALGRELWGEEKGSRVGFGAGLALLLYPTTLFFSAVYSESLFLALSLASYLAVLKNRGGSGALTASLGVLTRPFGVLLAIPLLGQWWPQRKERPWIVLFLPAMAFSMGLYLLYCFGLFGDAVAFIHRQARWRGASVFPGFALLRWAKEGPTLHGGATSSLELLMALALLALLPMAFRRLPKSLALYYLLGLALPLSSSLWSFGRIASNLFPLYLMLGLLWADEGIWPRLLFGVSALLSLVAMAFFGAGWWVG